MSIYAIGDLHLSFDERIEKPMDVFGSRWINHTERLMKNWNEKVSSEDTVIIAGDVSWGLKLSEAMADFKWIHELNGKKVIIKGNHDLWWNSINKLNNLYEDLVFLQNRAHFITLENGKKLAICGTRGWISPGTDGFSEHDKKIYLRENLRLNMSLEEAKIMGADEIIATLHFPPTNDKMQGSGFTELLSKYNVKTCVYGHLHGKDAFKNGLQGIYNGVDYKLVSLDYLEGTPALIL
ncbi:MAG: metallophosphoesterase [Eubacteriales bacterium]|jgi:predicted phosphohydrolase|nr:metallophosphoesterase [Eubacteriales bacterium]